MRCQRPAASGSLCPRQSEKSESRSLSVAFEHATFHGNDGSVVLGQLDGDQMNSFGTS